MRAIAVALGAITLASVVLLLVWDVTPQSVPDAAHLVLGAIPLALIAVSYLLYQGHVRPLRAQLLRAIILALAFVCWAENQLLRMDACLPCSTTWPSDYSCSMSS